MNFPWAICIAREDAASLAALRLTEGIEVGEDGALIWLRGQRGDEPLAARLAHLPARGKYEWRLPHQLRPVDRRIPSARLPELPWQALHAWLQVGMPAAALPGIAPEPVPLRLVRSTREQEPELLLTRLEDLKAFAAGAAQVRLNRLQFAADANGAVLVRGQPLPPLPGQRFVLHAGVAVPAGFSWAPAVSAEVLARCFGVASGTVVVWTEGRRVFKKGVGTARPQFWSGDSSEGAGDEAVPAPAEGLHEHALAEEGTLWRLHAEQFVPLSRSALRATEQAVEAL